MITEFSIEVRRAACQVMLEDSVNTPTKSTIRSSQISSDKKSPLDEALNAYYDEFVGKVSVNRRSQSTMNCRHGFVVKALRNALINRGKHFKSLSMDFVVETEKDVLLYEVKTGSDSQSIYTGIGQLYFHSAALLRKFPGKKVIRHLVIPFAPSAANREKVCRELGIRIVTFELSNNKVEITASL
jgi:hypothetical protein